MTTINPASTATGASTVSSALDKTEIASNFTMFLQLLTTQLRNQRRIRRSYRSTARTTHSTRSSASFDQRREPFSYVITGLVPVISLGRVNDLLSGIAGTSPAMTG